MTHYAVSHLGLHCLPLSHLEDAMLKWVNEVGSSEVIKPFSIHKDKCQ